MKLVCGLGNPGGQYETTRHNAGFMAVDLLADRLGIDLTKTGWRSIYGQGQADGASVIIAKPQTYMNLSGEAVGAICRYFKIPPEDVVVVYDDMDLPLGAVRIRPDGGIGGHKGLDSVIRHLGSPSVARVRIGVGRPELDNPVDYVLSTFSEEQWEVMREALTQAACAAAALLNRPVEQVMNEYNRTPAQ